MPKKASEQTQPAEQGGSEALWAVWSDLDVTLDGAQNLCAPAGAVVLGNSFR